MVWLSFPLFALFCFLLFCLFVCLFHREYARYNDMTTTSGNRVAHFSHVTQLVISSRDGAIPSFSKVLYIMKLFLLMIYEINHIWTAEMKWEWRGDRRSERNLCNCVKKPEKISGLDLPPNVSGFIAQLVEHRTGNREVTGSNPVEVLNLFQASLRNCINCDHRISSR